MFISTGELLSQSTKIYLKHFKTLISYFGVQILLILVSFAVPAGFFYLGSKTYSGLIVFLGVITYVLGICAIIYGSLWISVATVKAARNAIEEKTMSMKEVFQNTRSLILPAFGTNLLKIALIYLGILAFVIPGIYMLVAYAFAETAVVYDEPKEGAAAIRLSRSLNFGRWWGMLGRWIVAYVLPIIAIALVATLLSLPFKGSHARAASEQRVPLTSQTGEYNYDSGDVPPSESGEFNALGNDYSNFDYKYPSKNFFASSASPITPRYIAFIVIFSILSLLISPYFLIVAGVLYTSAKANQIKKL